MSKKKEKELAVIAQQMAAVEVQFQTSKTVAEASATIMEYLSKHSEEIQMRAKELKLAGGLILDEVIVRYYNVTNEGVTKADMRAILNAVACGRKDVVGYAGTFASTIDAEMKAGCPKRVRRFKKEGKFCVVPVTG